jgi:hypothetical protein
MQQASTLQNGPAPAHASLAHQPQQAMRKMRPQGHLERPEAPIDVVARHPRAHAAPPARIVGAAVRGVVLVHRQAHLPRRSC